MTNIGYFSEKILLDNTKEVADKMGVYATDDRASKSVYDVLIHTDDVLVIQTNAGMDLYTADGKIETVSKAIENQSLQTDPVVSYGKFNLGLHVEDNPSSVSNNRCQLLNYLNQYLQPKQTTEAAAGLNSQPSSIDAIYWLNQIHSDQVVRIGSCNQSANLSLIPPAADALVTSLPQQALAIMTADCVPIALYDPESKQVAAIHAGWQGLAKGIIKASYDEMIDSQQVLQNIEKQSSAIVNKAVHDQSIPEQGVQKKAMQAWIGSCISESCYEVSYAVVDKLVSACATLGISEHIMKQQVIKPHQNPNKAWLNLPKLAELQLISLGIEVHSFTTHTGDERVCKTKADNDGQSAVTTTTINGKLPSTSKAYACSYDNKRYYSYRRQTHLRQQQTGRMALIIVRLK